MLTHPDISAIKSSINLDRQYKIDVIRNSDFDGDFDNYDLIINLSMFFIELHVNKS